MPTNSPTGSDPTAASTSRAESGRSAGPDRADPACADTAHGDATEQVIREGRTDGHAGVDPDLFATALTHRVAESRFDGRLAALREERADVEAQIDTIQSLQRDGAAADTRDTHLSARAKDLETRKSQIDTSIEAVEQEQLAKQKRGSVLYAGLYTVAGIFFIAGDVIMSREIVANALKLPGSVEPWVFAIGLAMLAVLVKPAYDRLVEERYWNGRPAWFTGTIAVCAIGALSTLWILGAFRSTAFVSNTKIQRLTAELVQTEDPARIAEIESQVGALQQSLIESPLGYWAFVLSGVLFALAGAVCLGIGFRHIRDAYHLRWSLYRSHRDLSEERETVAEQLDAIRTQIADHRVEQSRARQALNDLPPLKDLRARRDDLRRREQQLLDERADVECDRLEALYRRAHAQGEAGLAPADAGTALSTGDGAPELSVNGSRTGPERTGPNHGKRPHRALRDILRDDRR